MLTLLTVGTHQPYSAPADYLARYPNAKQAAVAYLDDAIGAFLADLENAQRASIAHGKWLVDQRLDRGKALF